MKYLLIFVLSLSMLWISCSDDGQTQDFDRGPILSNAANNIIIPAYQEWDTENENLIAAVSVFTESPDQANLDALKSQWLTSRMAWKTAEIYYFGPVDNRFLYDFIDIYPVSADGIEEAVDSYDGSANYVGNLGNTMKGYGGIEYLLFDQANEQVLTSFEDENRRGYLVDLAAELKVISGLILGDWETSYAEEFIASTGNDAGSSITQYTNSLIQHIEEIKNFKLEIPLGLRTNSDPLPDLVESPFANTSAELIVENLNAIEEAFLGGQGEGLDDYLDALDASDDSGDDLSEVIVAKIDECRTLASQIDNLSEAVTNGDQEPLDLLQSLQELTTLTKSDMMSQLGLIITFSSNDGDS